MKLSSCLFYIPQSYNDGKLVEAEVILKIIRNLDEQFGRCTIGNTIEGVWEGRHELMRPVRIAVRSNQVAHLKKTVREIGKQLGQKAMYFESISKSAELIYLK